MTTEEQHPFDGLRGGSDYNEDDSKEKELPTVADKLLAIVNQSMIELFEDQYNKPYAVVKIDERIEAIPIPVTHNNNGLFKKWICKTYYDSTKKLMSNTDAISAVSNHLSWKAHYNGNKKDLDLRVSYGQTSIEKGCSNKTVYYDLTNKHGNVVSITKDSWSIRKSTDVPVMFDRRNIQRAQVDPVSSGQYPTDIFEQFMGLLNVKKEDRMLLMCYIISLFLPKISKPILMLHGPEGAAKSACQKIIKRLVDPTSTSLLKLRQREDDLILQFADNYLIYYDNVSQIPEWISDLFCMIATGTSFSKRMLYFDDQEMVFELIRPIGFNGINLAASKPDLLDRGLNVELDEICENQIKLFEREIIPQFDKLKPYLLSYIFDMISKVLAFEYETEGKGLQLASRTRMADWEEYGEIIARCMGLEPFRFLDAYRANREKKIEVILEESPIAQAVVKLMVEEKLMEVANGNGSGSWIRGFNQELIWRGSPSQFLAALKPIANYDLSIDTNNKQLWPKAPNVLMRRMAKIRKSLTDIGISINRGYNTQTRERSVEIVKISLQPLQPLQTENHAQITSDSCNDICNGINACNDIEKNTVAENDENHAQKMSCNGNNDNNDIFVGSTEKPYPETFGTKDKWSLSKQDESQRFIDEVERLRKANGD